MKKVLLVTLFLLGLGAMKIIGDILGPYIMHGGETLMVEIDSREWGVIVQSEDHITVDVWISEATKKSIHV